MEITPQALYDAMPQIRGFDINASARARHSVVIPFATYSPWLEDDGFMRILESISGYTLVDIYRCYELWSIVEQTGAIPGDLLEVGVWRGGTGALMARRLKDLDVQKKIYLCDTFSGVVLAGEHDSHYTGGEHADSSIDIVSNLCDRLDIDNYEIIKGVFPDESAQALEDNSFSLVHIDVDVYEGAKRIVEWSWDRLNVGGVIIFDDYGFPTCDGVTRLVNELRDMEGAIMIHNLNGHAILIKIA